MDEKEIKQFIEDTIKGTFSQIELSSKLKELDTLKETNKQLVAKLASVEEAEIPAEKVEEITEIVDKAIGDKVDTAIGEALADVIERVEAVESSMTDRQRIKKALSGKNTPFKAMSRPSKAYTEGSDIDVEKELNAISDKLKCAKDKKELEEVKNLLQAFMSSASKKIKLSADEDTAELEAYRELGTIDEIEAAVEVLETYAEEIGSLPELEAPEGEEGEEGFEAEELDIEAFASKRRKALASKRRKAFASKRKQASAKKQILSSKKKEVKKVNNASRVERLKNLKDKATKLSGLRAKENTNRVELSSASKEAPGALASSLFSRK